MNANSLSKSNYPATTPHPCITEGHLTRLAVVYLRQSTVGQVEENWGSTDLQRRQVEIARSFGWQDDQILIIDEDLGRSGSTTIGRNGWIEMLRLVAEGSVGAVFALNVSRLARALVSFEELRTLARFNGTILILDGRVVDPNDHNDAALAQVQAVFAELENQGRAKHLRASRLEKARSGKVVSRFAVGWVENADGQYEFDPEVKAVIDEVYVTFRRLRTARKTVADLRRRGISIPSRYRGRLEWKPATIDRIRKILTNEAYAGTYLYNKSETHAQLGRDSAGRTRRRALPPDQWVRHDQHHPAYVTSQEQQEFQRILSGNAFQKRDRPREGPALLQGLARCARCGATMNVSYQTRGDRRYQCNNPDSVNGTARCYSITGRELDEAVAAAFLERLGKSSVAFGTVTLERILGCVSFAPGPFLGLPRFACIFRTNRPEYGDRAFGIHARYLRTYSRNQLSSAASTGSKRKRRR